MSDDLTPASEQPTPDPVVPPPTAQPPVQPPIQPQMPAAGYGTAPTAPTTEPMAIVVLVCAIGSWVLVPVVLAIVALVLAPQADRAIDASQGMREGKGLVTAGRVLAWIQLALTALFIVFVIALIVGFAATN